jgi:hypothetical protein
LIHSGLSQTAWPTNAGTGLTNPKPADAAAAAMVLSSWSAVWFSRVISLPENHVSRLQSVPLKIRG